LHIIKLSPMDGASADYCAPKSICLRISESDVFPAGKSRLKMDQAYRLAIMPDKQCITVTGSTPAGVFYGVVSLISLLQGDCILNFDT